MKAKLFIIIINKKIKVKKLLNKKQQKQQQKFQTNSKLYLYIYPIYRTKSTFFSLEFWF
jgi:hypothetical protein